MTHYFANVLYLSICMLGNCSCFYFRMLTFFKKNFFLKINHPGPPKECQIVWIQIKTDITLVFIWVQTVCKRLLADDKIIHWHWFSFGFKLFAKGYWQTTKSSTGMQIVITGKYFSVQYIVSYRDIHASCIP